MESSTVAVGCECCRPRRLVDRLPVIRLVPMRSSQGGESQRRRSVHRPPQHSWGKPRGFLLSLAWPAEGASGNRTAGIPMEVCLDKRGPLPGMGEDLNGVQRKHLGQLPQDLISRMALIALNQMQILARDGAPILMEDRLRDLPQREPSGLPGLVQI